MNIYKRYLPDVIHDTSQYANNKANYSFEEVEFRYIAGKLKITVVGAEKVIPAVTLHHFFHAHKNCVGRINCSSVYRFKADIFFDQLIFLIKLLPV